MLQSLFRWKSDDLGKTNLSVQHLLIAYFCYIFFWVVSTKSHSPDLRCNPFLSDIMEIYEADS